MDELNSSFGRLSTSAPEWKPGQAKAPPMPSQGLAGPAAAAAAALPPSSDLSASTFREFVPGQNWTATAAPSSGILPPAPPPYDQTDAYQQGHGGGGGVGAYGEASQHYQQQQHLLQEQHLESTLPSGPNPPPPVASSSAPPMGVFPPPNFRAIHSLGAGDELWRHYRERSLAAARQMDPADPRHKAIPPPYCNAYCLDPPGSPSRSSFGYPSGTFQVTSRDDGHLYCLRRYDNCRAASSAAAGGKLAASVMDRWANPLSGGGAGAAVTDHPGIVPLVACFAAQRAFFFVHRLVPGAQTLRERLQAHVRGDHHHHPPHRRYPGGGPPEMLPEPLLWSCLSQLASALSAAHGVGLAVRSLDARHVLVTELPPPPPRSPNGTGAGAGIPRWRVRINCAGVLEALESETRRHAHEWQQLDLRALGRLVLGMAAAGRLGADPLDDDGRAQPGGLADAEAVLAQNYSRELHNLVVTLLRSGGQPQQHPGAAVPPPTPSIRDVVRALWPHTQAEADRAGRDLDRLESSLSAEYDAGRALRLLLKLGFVNGRPEFGPNRRWSQSGDCYVLSLFRDYVFHQADGGGYPVMDLGHVITALNKLDAGDPERIVLASRDGISVVVVSYGDVARCLESAFHELCAGASVVAGSAPPHSTLLPY